MALAPSRAALAVSAFALFAAAGSARATTFSFASDDDSEAFTLRGVPTPTGFSILNGRSPAFTPVTLKIDDDNGVLPTVDVAAGLLVNLHAVYAGSIGAGNTQTHTYDVTGTFSFVRPDDGTPLVVVNVNGGSTLAINGTAIAWSSAGTMFGSDAAAGNFSGVDYQTDGLFLHLAGQGINPSDYGFHFAWISEDFSFSLTRLNNDNENVPFNPETHLPNSGWEAEASYSGHAVGVPAPGAAGALAAGLAVALRRRRRR